VLGGAGKIAERTAQAFFSLRDLIDLLDGRVARKPHSPDWMGEQKFDV
jgi:phosphatidylserine synthase